MHEGKIINLDDYRDKKIQKQNNKINSTNQLKKLEEDDRKNTFNLFMRVLATIKQEIH